MLNKNGGYDGFTLPSMWYEYGGFCTGIGMSTIDVFSELINKKKLIKARIRIGKKILWPAEKMAMMRIKSSKTKNYKYDPAYNVQKRKSGIVQIRICTKTQKW